MADVIRGEQQSAGLIGILGSQNVYARDGAKKEFHKNRSNSVCSTVEQRTHFEIYRAKAEKGCHPERSRRIPLARVTLSAFERSLDFARDDIAMLRLLNSSMMNMRRQLSAHSPAVALHPVRFSLPDASTGIASTRQTFFGIHKFGTPASRSLSRS